MDENKTLPNTWRASLNQLLHRLKSEATDHPRIAILGVGNPFRADDAAGVFIARTLSNRAGALDTDHVLIMEAGQAPENTTAELRKFAPHLVLFVDAANMGKAPGTIEWIMEESIDGMSASTHSLPLSILSHYLRLELDCKVNLLGVQPRSLEVGGALSAEVLEAIQEIVLALDAAIRSDLSLSSVASKPSM